MVGDVGCNLWFVVEFVDDVVVDYLGGVEQDQCVVYGQSQVVGCVFLENVFDVVDIDVGVDYLVLGFEFFDVGEFGEEFVGDVVVCFGFWLEIFDVVVIGFVCYCDEG